ncbi:MAG TPA: phosphotriesterase-related protein [Methylomirabilota bacterium]|jgi:phosphotriesterase-related protein|nr:phosphotriesterase-related protein [Methylomirabilota bacterium]
MPVMTVRGPIGGDALGLTLPHEHLFLDLFRITRVRDALLNDEVLMTQEAARFKACGGSTIVEVTNHGLRRNAAAMRRVAEATSLHVVMGSGWYREPYYDHDYIARRTTADLAADIVREIEEGEPETGIRPGIIGEIGADWSWVSPAEERVHRAAARAHRRTGLAITLHALESPVGLQQLDILQEEGADLRRVIVGHSDTWPDPDYHEAIARRGACVQFDTIRGLHPYEVEKHLRLVREVVRRGHLSQLLLSHDNCFRSHLVGYGGNGFAYIPTRFVSLLKDAGLSDEQLHVLLVENPRRLLTGER